jgi:hypothetical protein
MSNLQNEREIAKYFAMSSVNLRPDACQLLYQNTQNMIYSDEKRNFLNKMDIEVLIECDYCKSEFLSKGIYHYFCSTNCRYESALKRDREKSKRTINCSICNLTVVVSNTAKTCRSKECIRIYNLKRNYELLHNNFPKYLRSLCRNRKDPRLQKHFDGDFLMELLEKQNYKCALSGEPLTCIAEMNTDKSKFRRFHQTNVSVDRIRAGEPYTKDNVQLVCLAVNIGRSNFEINEYIDWCKKVAVHNKKINEDKLCQ